MSYRGTKKGFTLVELSLSIAFIAILSITIVLIITDMIATYQRGLVLRQVNTVGSEIIDDIRASIASSSAKTIEDDAFYKTKIATVTIGKEDTSVAVSGAFCTGKYSYIWNSGYFFAEKVKTVQKATLEGYDSDIKLLKVQDANRDICKNYNEADNKFQHSNIFDADPEELLGTESSSNLALYDFYIADPAQDDQSKNALYSGSFILATIQGGINIKTSGNYCTPPGGYDENFDYCAINKFNFAMQANGG